MLSPPSEAGVVQLNTTHTYKKKEMCATNWLLPVLSECAGVGEVKPPVAPASPGPFPPGLASSSEIERESALVSEELLDGLATLLADRLNRISFLGPSKPPLHTDPWYGEVPGPAGRIIRRNRKGQFAPEVDS